VTSQKSFKRLVRRRMDKTGESYTAARAVLLAAVEPAGSQPPPFVTSDDTIRQRTGRGWEQWLDLLDEEGAADLSHRDIARRVARELGIGPLVWEAQAVAISYERARGLRVVGQHSDGFSVTAAKTVAVPVDRLYDAFVEESLRRQWLPDGDLRTRTATRPRSARFDWGDGRTRVHVSFDAKDDARSTASLAHSRLDDAGEADRMKAYWRERMTALKARLEGGGFGA
jgi:hypothetical protein